MSVSRRTYTCCAVAAVLHAAPIFAEEAADKVEVIVVTASGYEQNLLEAPATMSVISGDELRKKAYTDITDALKHVAGIQIMGGGVEQSILIRGMAADYTQFLIDGKPMQGNDSFGLNGAQAGTPINFLPPIEAIERIEVIRGPASSLYGSDAMGGVINIITRKVHNEWNGGITTEYSKADSDNKVNEDGFQTSVYLNAPLIKDTLSLQLNGALQNQEESLFVGGSDSAASDPEYKKKNIGSKLGWQVDKDNIVTLGHTYAWQERLHRPGRSLAARATESYSQSIKNNYFLTHEGNYEGWTWKSYANYDTSENPSRINANTGNGISFDVLTVNSQATLILDQHTLSGGFTFENESLKDGATNGLRPPVIPVADAIVTMERDQYSVYLEDHWRLIDDLTLTLSGRFDDNERFGSHFSPKAYAVYSLSDNFVLKGGVTSGFKAPSLRQSATDFGATSMGGVVIGNPELKPETTLNYEAGIGYTSSDNEIDTSLVVYKTDYEDKINRTGRICLQNQPCTYKGTEYPAHQFGYTAYENIDEAELKGVEMTFDYRITDALKYRHSYTYTSSVAKTGTYAGQPLTDLAKHMFNASIDWEATDQLTLWAQTNFRSKTTGRWQTGTSGASSNGIQYPAYGFTDLGFAYKPKDDLMLKAGVYNVGNKEVTSAENYAYILDGRKFVFSVSHTF
ncbi:TonB-dependent receptor domain-containing protein [Rheinheimera texasensis]|uniref:TonB-dependent receptor domain-containing protein n=1 Tax=Rheinheimera texasensis TaxID=306205 RepID=UPI00055B96D3|nr:TonB-dependent receptor [Rheinheimera texasensis]